MNALTILILEKYLLFINEINTPNTNTQAQDSTNDIITTKHLEYII